MASYLVICALIVFIITENECDASSSPLKWNRNVPSQTKHPYGVFQHRKQVAEANLKLDKHGSSKAAKAQSNLVSETLDNGISVMKWRHPTEYSVAADGSLLPGDVAQPFSLYTLDGLLSYPGSVINTTTPILFYLHDENSGFCNAMWSDDSLNSFFETTTNNTHFVFIPNVPTSDYYDAQWMSQRMNDSMEHYISLHKSKASQLESLKKRIHYVTTPTMQLGNWIPQVFKNWMCVDHNCGYDQAVFTSDRILSLVHTPMILPRLDARYDWLPSPSKFKNSTLVVKYAGDGCQSNPDVKQKVAMVTDSGCSFFTKVHAMQQSDAVAVIVLQETSETYVDMNCQGSECNTPLSIPACMVIYDFALVSSENLTVKFQNTPSDNFFMGIDQTGKLAEVGWFLYPSFAFLNWQAQWFNFRAALEKRLSQAQVVLPILNDTMMHGKNGAVSTVTLPHMSVLSNYSKVELDMSLSCPGDKDTTCPHWDHTVQLFVCCDKTSPLCGMELGRWISPFRRRIGRWLTDVTALLPLLSEQTCTFTMKTVPWAMAWKPSLNLRLSGKGVREVPVYAQVLYQPGANFDKNYNQHFKPVSFSIEKQISKVAIVSVITGHGSDENGCGEFCVTSHHFVINNKVYNRTFDNAGTPLGCAERVPEGVEPNEHGTWLYGRDGWCDGQQVDPWVIDITQDIKQDGNTLSYFGWFQGKDPNPSGHPGLMTVYSYLVFYKKV